MRELVAAFGSIPQVSKENALLWLRVRVRVRVRVILIQALVHPKPKPWLARWARKHPSPKAYP